MKSKFFRVCICIALCLCLFTGVFAVMGWGSLLRQVGSAVMYPFSWLAGKNRGRGGGLCGILPRYPRPAGGKTTPCAPRISRSARDFWTRKFWKNENSWLYRYLSMKQEREDWSLVSCAVTATEWSGGSGGQSYAIQLTLNRGSSSGVAVGMPVVCEAGLVGIVSEVGVGSCRVRTVLNTDFAAGAIDARSGETGLWEGKFASLPSGNAVLTALAAEADAAVGDVILTSGKGGVYPYGIPVGRIASVSANAYSRTTEATVTPFADLTNLRLVAVLTDYVHYTDGSHWQGGSGAGDSP
ncbi:MAG: rod shape-determining protein MreC [Oscillospiraceae bacterium]|nr:MAG: rod shape-determining protein MreC [Oscillospiraceae bacterium]